MSDEIVAFEGRLFHYTDNDGFDSIRAQPIWVFKASQPPGDHPRGAYFTTLRPGTAKLAKRLRIPRTKTDFVFCFSNGTDLKRLEGSRGDYIFYSSDDYAVVKTRQIDHGPSQEVLERLP